MSVDREGDLEGNNEREREARESLLVVTNSSPKEEF